MSHQFFRQLRSLGQHATSLHRPTDGALVLGIHLSSDGDTTPRSHTKLEAPPAVGGELSRAPLPVWSTLPPHASLATIVFPVKCSKCAVAWARATRGLIMADQTCGSLRTKAASSSRVDYNFPAARFNSEQEWAIREDLENMNHYRRQFLAPGWW